MGNKSAQWNGANEKPKRDDDVTDGGYPEKVLKNAPDRESDFFAVPKVVE